MQQFQTSVHYPSNGSLLFILLLALQAGFIVAAPTYSPLLVWHLKATHHHISFYFVDITAFPPQYPACQDYLYLKYAEMKVEALRDVLCH